MENEFILPPVNATIVEANELRVTKATEFVSALYVANAEISECFLVNESDGGIFNEGDEIVVFDLMLDISQRSVVDIRYIERLAVSFSKTDETIPWVFALRRDFPPVLHRIATYFDRPYCLCIYEKSYDDLKLEWRAQQFLDDIRRWLVLTSADKLHQEDQPLEPFLLFTEGRIVLPADISPEKPIYVYRVSECGNQINLVANNQVNTHSEFQCISVLGNAQEHGIIDTIPNTLSKLHSFLHKAGIDLMKQIKRIIKEMVSEDKKQNLRRKPLIIAQLPKIREGSTSKEYDCYCFISFDDLKTIGVKHNYILDGPDNMIAVPFPESDVAPESAQNSGIGILAPYFSLTKDSARLYSGSESFKGIQSVKICQIGSGAIGSEIFMNFTKTGLGVWRLVDDDIVLPHNLVRHYLRSADILQSKALALSMTANDLIGDSTFSTPIWSKYSKNERHPEVDSALSWADIIIDASASVPVARHLAARNDTKARRISVFLNPTATDLIIIAEDQNRAFALDELEFQYYRYLLHDPNLRFHLNRVDGRRYSNSCRDITTLIPPDRINLLSSIASSKLKKIITQPDPFVGVWCIQEDSLEVHLHQLDIGRTLRWSVNKWSVVVDDVVLKKIAVARVEKLPVETGGILIGGYDFEQRKIYIVDTILSPADSVEKRESYIRGIAGVKELLQDIDIKTAGHLKYIGEWHSHPDSCSLDMSPDDQLLFADVETEMALAGFPGLILIAGEHGSFNIYLTAN